MVQIAFSEVYSNILSIPPRSPDINPIENLFHLVGRLCMNRTENFPQELHTFNSFPIESIDAVIQSMDKRMDVIIIEEVKEELSRRGQRIKY